MAGLKDIASNQETFDTLSAEAKQKVFDELSTTDEDYSSLSEEAKTKVKTALVGMEESSSENSKLTENEKFKVAGGMLDFIPQVKTFQEEFQKGQQEYFDQHPGRLESERGKKLIKQVGGSVALGFGAGAVAAELPWLMKIKQASGLTPASFAQRSSVVMQNTIRGAGRLAVEGAAAAQTFDYKDLQDRITKTIGASGASVLIGGAINASVKSGVSIGRTVAKISHEIKDPRIPLIGRIKDSINSLSEKVSGIGSSLGKQVLNSSKETAESVKGVSGRTNKVVSSIESSTKDQVSKVRASLRETTRQVNNAVDALDSQLAQESDIAGKTFQEKIGGFFKKNGKVYGKELDIISDEVAKHGKLTRSDAADILKRTIQRSGSEAEIAGSPILDDIKNLLETKYSGKTLDASGNNMVLSNADEAVEFRQFLGEVRGIWKKAYTNAKRNVADEIPAAILQSEFGEFVSGLPGAEGFKGLQTAYRPVISYMNKANALIQPMRGEAYRGGAQALVKRYATKSASGAEIDLIKFLETGTERFGEGVGNVTARARQISENAKVLKESLSTYGLESERRLIDIAEQGAMKISKIKNLGEKSISTIEDEGSRLGAKILEEGARQEMQIAKRLQTLRGRGEEVEKLLAKRKIIRRVTAGLGLLTTTLSGGYGIYRSAKGASDLETTPNQ